MIEGMILEAEKQIEDELRLLRGSTVWADVRRRAGLVANLRALVAVLKAL